MTKVKQKRESRSKNGVFRGSQPLGGRLHNIDYSYRLNPKVSPESLKIARGVRGAGSVLDSRETFLHFAPPAAVTGRQKDSFISSHYRHRNLKLADKLASSIYANDQNTNKTIKSLRCCSKMSIVEYQPGEGARTFATSKTCKNPHCAICARTKSNRISNRLVAAITDTENRHLFQHKYFYFITITVKHDATTRNEIYLDAFNRDVNKLLRSKLFASQFGKVGKEWRGGWIISRECTLTPNGYHIHAHALLCGPRLPYRAADYQASLQKAWKKITGDSTGVRFDLIKTKPNSNGVIVDIDDEQRLMGAIREVSKYTVKAGKVEDWDAYTCDKYGAWVEATKGRNFINASGIFRGLQITGAKSIYDGEKTPKPVSQTADYYLVRTTGVRFNSNPDKSLGVAAKQRVLEKVWIKGLLGGWTKIAGIDEGLRRAIKVDLDEGVADWKVDEWALQVQMLLVDIIAERETIDSDWTADAANVEGFRLQAKQLEFFEDVGSQGWGSSHW